MHKNCIHTHTFRSTQQGVELAQVVPNSTFRSKSDDCMVPDQENDLSPLNSAPINELSPLNSAPTSMDVSTVQLTLSPMLMPFLSNPPAAMATNPGSPPFIPVVLRDFPPQVDRPHPFMTSSHNPFLDQSSSPPPLYVHTSLPRQHSASVGQLPPETTAHAFSHPLASFPPSSFVCHHYPFATMNVSGDSFYHESRPVMMTLDEPLPSNPSVSMTTNDSRQAPGQNSMEGLVTIRPSRHSFSSAGVDSIRVHSLSNERLSPQHLLAATHSNRRRRNSSSGDRVRRHSSQTVTMVSSDGSRRRRRSHDVNDERTELLEELRMASNRWSSRTQSVPIRIQLSSPTTHTPPFTSHSTPHIVLPTSHSTASPPTAVTGNT